MSMLFSPIGSVSDSNNSNLKKWENMMWLTWKNVLSSLIYRVQMFNVHMVKTQNNIQSIPINHQLTRWIMFDKENWYFVCLKLKASATWRMEYKPQKIPNQKKWQFFMTKSNSQFSWTHNTYFEGERKRREGVN